MKAYYADYAQEYPQVIRAAWGYTVEAATQAIRLVLSRVFENHDGLNIILGHMGETLPFLLWRINQALSRPGHEETSLPRQFCGISRDHERQFLDPRATVHHDRTRHGPHHVRNRLALRGEQARDGLGGKFADFARGQGESLSGNAKRLLRMLVTPSQREGGLGAERRAGVRGYAT